MTLRTAFFDIFLLALVSWGVWSLRFAGVDNVGLWSMVAGVAAGAILMAVRREKFADIGLRIGGSFGWTLERAIEAFLVIIIVGGIGIGAATALGYPPTTPSSVSEQPEALSAFLLDILVGVWIGAALGEEIFFRGMLLSKFTALFGGGRAAWGAAALAQAIWFGAGHASQGLGGMFATGLIGLALAIFYVTRSRRSLAPMIIGHGLVNTMTLSIAYFT